MVQAYNKTFAGVYNMMWTDFADGVASHILEFYKASAPGRDRRPVLDLFCGTGTLALHFLAEGFEVTGVDASEYMLNYALDNAREYVEKGKARFTPSDVTEYSPDREYGLVLATYDSLNHLDGFEAAVKCLRLAHAALAEGGVFIFDLNTRKGLRHWAEITVDESPEVTLITRGGYDDRTGQAFYKLSGFVHTAGGLYERFEEMIIEKTYPVAEVLEALLDIGFREAYAAAEGILDVPLAEPEKEDRAFFVAIK